MQQTQEDIPLARSSSISTSLSFADMDRYSAVTEYRFDWRTEREPSWDDIVFWRETGTKDEVVDEVDAREGACSIETAMSGNCRHRWVSVWDLGSKGRERDMGGCTSRGAWANQKVGTQVRVRLFGSTRRCARKVLRRRSPSSEATATEARTQ
jgi:hypothetical protein